MDLNARVIINCGRIDGKTGGWTENKTPILHLAKAGGTKLTLGHNSKIWFFFSAYQL